jgi:hypothetical protein
MIDGVMGQEPKSASAMQRDTNPKPLRLFELHDTKRLKSLKVGEYALRRPRYPRVLRDVLFAYT